MDRTVSPLIHDNSLFHCGIESIHCFHPQGHMQEAVWRAVQERGKRFISTLMSATLVHWCWPTSEHTMSTAHPSSSHHHCLSSLDEPKGHSCMAAVPTLLERHRMDSVVSVEGLCIGARGIEHACIRVEERIGLSVCRRSSEKSQDGSCLFYRMCPPIRVSSILIVSFSLYHALVCGSACLSSFKQGYYLMAIPA
jgi:hypothetical protein